MVLGNIMVFVYTSQYSDKTLDASAQFIPILIERVICVKYIDQRVQNCRKHRRGKYHLIGMENTKIWKLIVPILIWANNFQENNLKTISKGLEDELQIYRLQRTTAERRGTRKMHT